uniref:BACK domain-containing protein n=1 Tax=Aegilops tauschii subsp. strangulata TaxID=200361 RepID=A0A453LM96_AEGTS
MYSGKLTPTTEPTLLVNILMAADKFEVVSCMKLCGQRLIDQPMTPESAVRCLDLSRSISMASAIKEEAKKFLAERYKEFLSTEFQDELMRIPLAGILAILSRNRLGMESEGSIYDFLFRWACLQYPNSEERHKILSSQLLPLGHKFAL